MEHIEHEPSSAKTWVIVLLLLLIVLFQGGLAYVLIGDRGQPDWQYRPIKDVPGESSYAVYEYLPFPQHVLGGASDYPPLVENWNQDLERNWNHTFFPSPKQNSMGE